MRLKSIKKIIIILCLIFSTNMYAAIAVTDNDGSAFITKSEFDALKSSFQAQIDSYNQSIDSKIDEAIASYLSGINIAKKVTESSGILELNKKAKEVYKWWTDTINVNGSKKPVHGYYGGFITMTFSLMNQDWTADGKTVGTAICRYTIADTSDPDYNFNYFKWYAAADKVDALYYENSSDSSYGTYLTGNNYTVQYYKGFEGSQVTHSVTVMNKNEVFGSATSYKNTKYDLWFHFANNIAQYASIGTDNSWNSDTFSLPWQIYGETHTTTPTKFGTHKPGLFQYHGEDIEQQEITKDLKVLLINNYQRTVGSNEYYMTGVPIGANYSSSTLYSLNDSKWNEAQLDTSAGKEYAGPVTEHVRIATKEYNTLSRTINAATVHAGSTIDSTYGEVQNYVWKFHPYTNINTSSLIDIDTSQAYGSALKPYEGAYVAKASMDGVMRLKLRFHARDISTQQVKFAIRDEKFSTSTKLVSNVVQTAKSIGTWEAATEVPLDIRFNVTKGKEYFIQVVPNTSGQLIGIEQIENIEVSETDNWTDIIPAGSGLNCVYTAALISDDHDNYTNAPANVKQALINLKNKYGAEFIISCGDHTSDGTVESNWTTWKSHINGSGVYTTADIYSCVGNHEVFTTSVSTGRNYFNKYNLDGKYNGSSVSYYCEDLGSSAYPDRKDRFIFVALENCGNTPASYDEFTDTQLNWIQSKIDSYTGKGKIWIVEHSPFYHYGPGDSTTVPGYSGGLKTTSAFPGNAKFKQLLEKNPQCIFIHGHTHIQFEDRDNGKNLAVFWPPSQAGCYSIHVPSLGYLSYLNGTGGIQYYATVGKSQAWIIKEYDDGRLILKGIDAYNGTDIPGMTYVIFK